MGLRETNDDLVFAGEHCRLYVALDGVGGYAGGGEASRIVLEQIRSSIESMCKSTSDQPDVDLKQAVATAISEASNRMIQVAKETPEYGKMGTVFALGYVVNDTLLYTRVGDARVYLVREGQAKQLTLDETYVQLMVDVGVIEPNEVEHHPLRNVVLNAVGTHPLEGPAKVYSTKLQPGDTVLLTTDGVSDKLSEEQLAALVSSDDVDPTATAKDIVQAALDAGTRDNASCVVVRIEQVEMPSDGSHEDLHAELTKLHDMLSNVDTIDDQLRSDMQQIATDIRHALGEEQPADLKGLTKDLNDRALAFEVSHPHLTNTIASIVNLLSRMGI